MSGRVPLLQVRSRRTPYRRGGIEFGNLPLVLGPEHFEEGLAGLRAIVAIVSDPVLTVKRSTRGDEEGDFITISQDEIAEMVEQLAILERVADLGPDRDDVSDTVADLIGDTILQSPKGPDAKGDDAAPAVETPPASDASTAPDEQLRAGADASEAAPAADADAAKQPEDTQQPPVVDGTARPAPSAGDTASPAAAASQPKKGDAIPAEAAAPATRKPRSSSGRKAAAPASAGGAKA